MKSRIYSLLEQGILKKPRKAIITYRSLITPTNIDTTIGQFTLYGIKSNDDPPIAISDTINLYPSADATNPYMAITIDIDPTKEITSIFYTLINPDNDFNLNCIVNHIELITEQGNLPIGLGIISPIASAATNITTEGFTANWSEIDEATGYKIDVSTDIDFSTFVTGYENKDISGGSTLSLDVTGLTEDVCYFYRVRAYNTSVTSLDSNIEHVQTHLQLPVYYAIATDVTEDEFFFGTHIKFDKINSTIRLYGINAMPNKWTIMFFINRANAAIVGYDYVLTMQSNRTGGTSMFEMKFDNSDAFIVSITDEASALTAIKTANNFIKDSISSWHSVVVTYDHTIPGCVVYLDGVVATMNPSFTTATTYVPRNIDLRAFFGWGASTSETYFKDFVLASGIATLADVQAFNANPDAALSVTKLFHLPLTDTQTIGMGIADYAYLLRNKA